MNVVCKYARMYNKMVARKYAKNTTDGIIYLIETVAYNQIARLKRRASKQVQLPPLITSELKLKYILARAKL